MSYRILEARETMGGTWDLFRYPGVRSDSDMYTLGFPFRPWDDKNAMADGLSILNYLKDTAREFGIHKKILYGHKILSSNWSSREKKWNVKIEKLKSKEIVEQSCRFLIMCSGYFDYDEGFTPHFAETETFKGKLIHPQNWDETMDYCDKNIVVIGSGATAVTLVPALAKKARQVVMLQRSPSYIASVPGIDRWAEVLKKRFPRKMAHTFIRWKNIFYGMLTFNYCKLYPNSAKRLLLKKIQATLNADNDQMKNFDPRYSPWDQRLCLVPDGDFLNSLVSKKAKIITDEIDKFTKNGILLKSGQQLEADIIISATGLKFKFLAGIEIALDGKKVKISESVPYKCSMFSGIPNLAMVFGYTNSSWTLRCSLATEWIANTLDYMVRKNYDVVLPEENPSTQKLPFIDFSSGYIKRAEHLLPKQGHRQPWKVNQNYLLDLYAYKMRPIADRGLKFY